MRTDSSNPFESIHALLAKGQTSRALSRLLDRTSGKLRDAFAWDANHAWYCVGGAEFRRGNYQDAVQAFRKAFRADSSDVVCLIAIGNCYDAQHKPKLAERVWREALGLEPKGRNRATVVCNLGNALFDQKRYEEAAQCYSPLVKRRDDIGRMARKNTMEALYLLEKKPPAIPVSR